VHDRAIRIHVLIGGYQRRWLATECSEHVCGKPSHQPRLLLIDPGAVDVTWRLAADVAQWDSDGTVHPDDHRTCVCDNSMLTKRDPVTIMTLGHMRAPQSVRALDASLFGHRAPSTRTRKVQMTAVLNGGGQRRATRVVAKL
jgi:hypothetical protein